jgi:hypothetical protein
MLTEMEVKIVNKTVVDAGNASDRIQKQQPPSYLKTSDRKHKHLVDIGMDLSKYHPAVIQSLIGGGRSDIPDALQPQILKFALEAKEKHFQPKFFGYGSKLAEIIRELSGCEPRKYNKKSKEVEKKPVVVVEPCSSSSSDSSTDEDSEENLRMVIQDITDCLNEGEFEEAKELLKRNKHLLPKDVYNKIKKNIN